MEQFVLFLHVLAASVWVGGQIVVGGIAPRMRPMGEGPTKALAHGFASVAWPAFGLSVVTGMGLILLNVLGTDSHPLFEVKMLFVLLSAGGALVHQTAKGNRARLAAGGAVGLLFGLAAMYAGVLLTG